MARVVSKRPRDRSLFASPLAECADPTSFLLLCAAVFCIFADQNLLAPNLSAIADDLGFDERERDAKLGGQISVAFFLLGLPACLVIGVLTDVARRKDLLVMTVVLGQGPCALAGFVTSFWQLFVLRALTGVAVGGALPLAFSIAGDLFPPTARSHASGTVGLVMHAGVIFGQGVSGYAGPIFGWRAPFVLVAIPGLCVAWLVDKYAVEPRRGGSDGGGAIPSASPGGGGVDDKKMGSNGTDAGVTTSFFASDATSTRETATRLAREWIRKSANVWRRRTNALGFTQGIPGTVPWSVINVFMNDYLANEKGLGVQLATTLMMTFSAGCAFGTILGGWLGQRLYNERGWYMTAAMGAFAVAGIFPWLYLIESNDYAPFDARRFGFKLIVAFVGGNLAAVTGAFCFSPIARFQHLIASPVN